MKKLNMEKIRAQFTDTLDEFDIEFKDRGVDENLSAWKHNKGGLIDTLRCHPYWDEDELAIVFSVREIRQITRDNVEFCYYNFIDLVNRHVSDLDSRRAVADAIKHIAYKLTQKFTGDPIYIKNATGIECNNDQSCSKIIRKICVKYGIDKVQDEINEYDGSIRRKGFEKLFPLLADSLNPMVIKNTALLSVHPCDYITMSHGNSWTSCHSNDPDDGIGCHRSGTISYMNDKTTMVFYTVKGNTDSEYHKARKLTRQTFSYADGVLLQSRLYPHTYDEKSRKLYRHIVQSAIADSLGAANLWKLLKSYDDVKRWHSTSIDSTHYPDYTYGEYKANVSLLNGANFQRMVMIGSKPLCLVCGNSHTRENSLYCSNGDCEDEEWCYACGYAINDDECRNVDGRLYCNDCSGCCERCGLAFVGGGTEVREYNWYGRFTVRVCDDCLEDYRRCDKCDERYALSYDDEGCNLCPDCCESMQAMSA